MDFLFFGVVWELLFILLWVLSGFFQLEMTDVVALISHLESHSFCLGTLLCVSLFSSVWLTLPPWVSQFSLRCGRLRSPER